MKADGGCDWVILVGGYGAFLFSGTAGEAEEMRAHKANWERGIGKLRSATDEEVSAGVPSKCWNHPGFNNKQVYVCRCDDCAALAKARGESA